MGAVTKVVVGELPQVTRGAVLTTRVPYALLRIEVLEFLGVRLVVLDEERDVFRMEG